MKYTTDMNKKHLMPPVRPTELTLAEHAEAWYTEQGEQVPPRDSEEWTAMYQVWVSFAFGPEKNAMKDLDISQ